MLCLQPQHAALSLGRLANSSAETIPALSGLMIVLSDSHAHDDSRVVWARFQVEANKQGNHKRDLGRSKPARVAWSPPSTQPVALVCAVPPLPSCIIASVTVFKAGAGQTINSLSHALARALPLIAATEPSQGTAVIIITTLHLDTAECGANELNLIEIVACWWRWWWGETGPAAASTSVWDNDCGKRQAGSLEWPA